jgi:hypothetical protein
MSQDPKRHRGTAHRIANATAALGFLEEEVASARRSVESLRRSHSVAASNVDRIMFASRWATWAIARLRSDVLCADLERLEVTRRALVGIAMQVIVGSGDAPTDLELDGAS